MVFANAPFGFRAAAQVPGAIPPSQGPVPAVPMDSDSPPTYPEEAPETGVHATSLMDEDFVREMDRFNLWHDPEVKGVRQEPAWLLRESRLEQAMTAALADPNVTHWGRPEEVWVHKVALAFVRRVLDVKFGHEFRTPAAGVRHTQLLQEIQEASRALEALCIAECELARRRLGALARPRDFYGVPHGSYEC